MFKKETISILGCGWYGLALAKALLADGYLVKGSSTSKDKLPLLEAENIKPYLVNFDNDQTAFDADFFNCDVLFICIPPKKNDKSLMTYPSKIKSIIDASEKAKVKHIVMISSSGVFQDVNGSVNETDIPQPTSEAGKALFAAENVLRQQQSITITIIRFGGLIGPNRTLAKHFAGRKDIANGLAPINLIHLNDCIGLSKAILQKKAFGNLFHAVSPDHPSRSTFYTKACLASGMAKPEFIAELAGWKQVDSVNVPEILGYDWKVRF
jgi:nucleoside-diphosphate-sugar epimerase